MTAKAPPCFWCEGHVHPIAFRAEHTSTGGKIIGSVETVHNRIASARSLPRSAATRKTDCANVRTPLHVNPKCEISRSGLDGGLKAKQMTVQIAQHYAKSAMFEPHRIRKAGAGILSA